MCIVDKPDSRVKQLDAGTTATVRDTSLTLQCIVDASPLQTDVIWIAEWQGRFG